jgi:hypothetical protein
MKHITICGIDEALDRALKTTAEKEARSYSK